MCHRGTGFDEQFADSYEGVAPAHNVSLTRSLGPNSWCPTGTLFSGMACGESRAATTIRGITGLEVVSQKAKVENGKISEYRVTMEVTFILEDG